jgi:hypothetical protein
MPPSLRAQNALGVETRKDGMMGGWILELPPKMLNDEQLRRCSKNPEDAQQKKVSTFGHFEHLRGDSGAVEVEI